MNFGKYHDILQFQISQRSKPVGTSNKSLFQHSHKIVDFMNFDNVYDEMPLLCYNHALSHVQMPDTIQSLSTTYQFFTNYLA